MTRLTDVIISENFLESFTTVPDLKITKNFIITMSGIAIHTLNKWSTLESTRMSHDSPVYNILKMKDKVLYYISMYTHHKYYGYQVINITKPAKINSKTVAVVGFEMELQSFKDTIFEGMSMRIEKMLINENAMIVLDYPYNHLGDVFLGIMQPYLLQRLVKLNIYKRNNYTECINRCKFREEHKDHSHASNCNRNILAVYNVIMRIVLFIYQLLISYASEYQLMVDYNKTSYVTYYKAPCCKKFTFYERNFDLAFNELLIKGKCGCDVEFKLYNVNESNVIIVEHLTPNCKCINTKPLDVSKGTQVSIHSACFSKEHQHSFVPSKTCVLKNSSNLTLKECSKMNNDKSISNSKNAILITLAIIIFSF